MKPIKIDRKNLEKIEKALAEVNGRAEQHTYTKYIDIKLLAEAAELRLNSLLYKKDFPGARYASISGGKTANSYKYMRSATHVCIERRSSDWYLISVFSTTIGPSGGPRDKLLLTTKQDIAAKAKLAEQYIVMTFDKVFEAHKTELQR